MTQRFSVPAAALAALLFGTACASTAPPSEKLETSAASIRAAEEVGATHSPNAALYLQLAKEEFGHASAMTDKHDRASADRMLLRAQTDAELSLALARNESEKTEAMGAINQVKTLKASETP